MKKMLKRGFKPAECKTALQMANSRLKILKNKKEIQIKYLRRELALLLESGHIPTARIRVEHVVREEKTMAAYELIGIYCELLVARLSIIESQKNCPIDLKEAVASVLFGSQRLSDIPELAAIEKQFTVKYGKDFATSAIELRPDSGVSRLLVEKLSAKAPDGPTKVKIMIEIATKYKVVWEAKSFVETDSSRNLNKEQSLNIQAPATVSVQHGFSERHHSSDSSNNVTSWSRTDERECRNPNHGYENSTSRSMHRWGWETQFIDSTEAAQAAAEAAERASYAARAAAELSKNERMIRQNSTQSYISSASVNFRNEPSHRRHKSEHVHSQSFSEERFSPRQNVTMHMDKTRQVFQESPTSPLFDDVSTNHLSSYHEPDRHAKFDDYGPNSESEDDQPRQRGKVTGDVYERMNRISDRSQKFDLRRQEESDYEADGHTGLKFRTLIGGLRNKNTLQPYRMSGTDDVDQSISTSSSISKDMYTKKASNKEKRSLHLSSSDDDDSEIQLRGRRRKETRSQFSYHRSHVNYEHYEEEEIPSQSSFRSQERTYKPNFKTSASTLYEDEEEVKRDATRVNAKPTKTIGYSLRTKDQVKAYQESYDHPSPKSILEHKTVTSSSVQQTVSLPEPETPSKERAGHVHPKLPDYDDIIAKFRALRAANHH